MILRVLTSLERERSASERVVPCAVLPSLSEAPVVYCRWRGASSVPVNHCVSASMDTAHVEIRHASLRRFGQRLCPDPRGMDGALGSGLPAIQDDPTTQRRRFAAQRAAENASRCGEEAKRRTQLGKKTKDEQRPSGQASAGVESLGPKHTSKKCFAECDMISEAARFCRATRGHSSAYCDAECLGCPASLVVNRGRAGTRVSPSVLR